MDAELPPGEERPEAAAATGDAVSSVEKGELLAADPAAAEEAEEEEDSSAPTNAKSVPVNAALAAAIALAADLEKRALSPPTPAAPDDAVESMTMDMASSVRGTRPHRSDCRRRRSLETESSCTASMY